MNAKNQISVIGLGHVGLPTAILLANGGYKVHGVDINKSLIADLQKNKTKINEKDFLRLFLSKKVKKNLNFRHSVHESDTYLIAVPTPIKPKSKKADLSMVINAVHNISLHLKEDDLIIIESTSPIGIVELIQKFILQKRKDLFYKSKPLFHIAYCPERVLPGNLVHELENNSRVIGGNTDIASNKAKKIYESFCKGEIILAESKVAEAVKLLENSYRDINIAFANEMSLLLDSHKIDSRKTFHLANMHPRVNILSSGIGVGGHCIPIDPYFLIESSDFSSILKTARKINDSMPVKTSQKIRKFINKNKLNSITILGLSYKPDISDFRESPAIEVVKLLSKSQSKFKTNLKISVYDPFQTTEMKSLLPKGIKILKDLKAMKGNNAIILVNHSIFESMKDLSCRLINID
jgi:UDP-N-acetyl-D-mannosaminuronic acid dehydrogenase